MNIICHGVCRRFIYFKLYIRFLWLEIGFFFLHIEIHFACALRSADELKAKWFFDMYANLMNKAVNIAQL